MHVTISFTEIERSKGHNLYTLDSSSLLGLPSPFLSPLRGLSTLSLLRYAKVNAINISSNKCNLRHTFCDIHQHLHVCRNMEGVYVCHKWCITECICRLMYYCKNMPAINVTENLEVKPVFLCLRRTCYLLICYRSFTTAF
jgi:hypothetical protein